MMINQFKRNNGFTYLGLLFFITLMGITLALAGTLYSFAQKREKERQLLFIGNQFQQAISLYYQRTPGMVKRYPQRLEDLLQDNRFVNLQRYLRRIYIDPMTKTQDWGLVRAPDGGVMGVYSQSNEEVLKTVSVDFYNLSLVRSPRYHDWKFSYTPIDNQKLNNLNAAGK